MRIIFYLMITLSLCSCAIKMSHEDFLGEVRRNGSSGFSSFASYHDNDSIFSKSGGFSSEILYKGSDKDYNYFYLSPKNGIPHSIKVSKNEQVIHDEFEYSDERALWIEYSLVK